MAHPCPFPLCNGQEFASEAALLVHIQEAHRALTARPAVAVGTAEDSGEEAAVSAAIVEAAIAVQTS